MTPESALEYINAAKSTGYTVAATLSGGKDQGAFRVAAPDGTSAVLKISRNPTPQWRAQIERAKAATDHLRPLGYPVPTYLYVDALDSGTFWLESELPGLAINRPTPDQISELVRLIDLQKDQTISAVQGQDWSWYVSSVVFRGESGLVRALMQFSPETSALAADIEGLVRGLDAQTLRNSDLVHGDFNVSQVLAENGKITAVLDWDQAGYGDRALDLVSLWYSLVPQPVTAEDVMKHALEITSPDVIKIFAAYKMLAVLAWHINKVGGDVAAVATDARAALEILRAL
jgi:aminoglycoside phosphotransferase